MDWGWGTKWWCKEVTSSPTDFSDRVERLVWEKGAVSGRYRAGDRPTWRGGIVMLLAT